ncbi:MAG TPA: antitoxin [Jatrophihabitans sp.]|jgi:hypothetical protein|nr:antitoxin [Jatrophihabitans sp.]
MVDFDDLRDKAEKLLGEHGDKVEDGIDKLADVAGNRLGHETQIDQAADKLKGFVDDQQAQQQAQQRAKQPGNRPRPAQGGNQRPQQGGGPKPRQGAGPQPKQGRRPRPT